MSGYTGRKQKRLSFRLIAAAVLAVIGAGCIALRFFGMRFTGFLCLGAAALLVVSFVLGRLSENSRPWRRVRAVFYVLLLVGLLGFSVLEAQVIRAGTSAPGEADAAIVLGAGVHGSTPSLALQSRLDAALAYAKEYPEIPLVLSGGQGYGEEISEAECMRRYLVEHGLGEGRLLVEETSTDTEENFRFSKALLEEQGYDTGDMTVAVVSNDFHLFRAEVLAQRAGLSVTGVGAPIPWLHLEINYYIREAFALVKTYFL